MDVKFNDSTELRPDGERILDAPLVHINIKEFTKQLLEEEAWKKRDRNAMTVYKTDGMRIVLIALHEDAVMARHKAEGIISVQVLKGKMNFITDERTVELEEGMMVTLHKGKPHSVAALKETVFLLTIAG